MTFPFAQDPVAKMGLMIACGTPEEAGTVLDVVTAGETMVLGVPSQPGRLRHASALELKIGGAESNVAIALSTRYIRGMGQLPGLG